MKGKKETMRSGYHNKIKKSNENCEGLWHIGNNIGQISVKCENLLGGVDYMKSAKLA